MGQNHQIMPTLPPKLQEFFADDELWIPKVASVAIAGPVLTIWGFFIGTIVGPDATIDLQWHDMIYGVYGAIAGALLGALVVAYAWIIFPRSKAQDSHDEHH